MALYARKLKQDERNSLEMQMNLNEEDLPSYRLKIILLSAAGRRVPEISESISLHPINVRKWIHRFNRYGLDGLRSGKSPGRPLTFSDEQRRRIITIASINPRLLGLRYSRWSLQRLRRYLIDLKVVDQISVETIRQIIQSQGEATGHRHRVTSG